MFFKIDTSFELKFDPKQVYYKKVEKPMPESFDLNSFKFFDSVTCIYKFSLNKETGFKELTESELNYITSDSEKKYCRLEFENPLNSFNLIIFGNKPEDYQFNKHWRVAGKFV